MAVGDILRVPIAHGDGNYYASERELDALEAEDRVVFRYVGPDGRMSPEANPNGSARHIAGIVNAGRNVLGMMPHPERCAESIIGSGDGRRVFESVLAYAGVAVAG
jgi:phosphoribosylformylglycinamidine synthase